MIDNFALALIHGLLAVVVWRLLSRADLDDDAAAEVPQEPVDPPRRG